MKKLLSSLLVLFLGAALAETYRYVDWLLRPPGTLYPTALAATDVVTFGVMFDSEVCVCFAYPIGETTGCDDSHWVRENAVNVTVRDLRTDQIQVFEFSSAPKVNEEMIISDGRNQCSLRKAGEPLGLVSQKVSDKAFRINLAGDN